MDAISVKPYLQKTWIPGLVCLIFLLLPALIGCNLQSSLDDSADQTLMARNVESTLAARQGEMEQEATIQAQNTALAAQAAQATLFSQQVTQMAQEAQISVLTTQIAAATLAAAVPPPPTQEELPAVVDTPPPASPAEIPAGQDFETWKSTASILLYEDMTGAEAVGTYPSFRYVKKVMDQMGLDYVDVGSAMGQLKTRLTSGGPEGQGWDLVVIAAERKGSVSGEFFDYMWDALERGSSVILEVWYLDKVEKGQASTILSKCGMEVYKNFVARNANEEAMYIVNADSPILHEPNDGLSFSNVTSYWPYNSTDLGDLMQMTERGDGDMLVGTRGTEKKRYGTVFSCMNGRLILQTFSSHQLAYDDMGLIWENYIYHALRARYLGEG